MTNAIKTLRRNKDRPYERISGTKNFQYKEILYDKFKRYGNYINILTKKAKEINSICFSKNIRKKCAKLGTT